LGKCPTSRVVNCVNDKMARLLAAEGAVLDAIYYTPAAGGEAVLPRYGDKTLAKPSPHLLLKAGAELGLDFSKAWMIGDNIMGEISLRGSCASFLEGIDEDGFQWQNTRVLHRADMPRELLHDWTQKFCCCGTGRSRLSGVKGNPGGGAGRPPRRSIQWPKDPRLRARE
jgi:hypothetical protein